MPKKPIYILGIESSCDETAAAVLRVQPRQRLELKSSVVASQMRIHARYGGVVPEVAARNHVGKIILVIDHALAQAKIKPRQLSGIAVTVGPGLMSSLLVGVQTATVLASVWKKPIIPVNHLHGHLYAPWLEHTSIKFPVMALVVSGGHTELVLLKKIGQIKKIGQTIDDAAGEAFDKVAQLLGLGYPGGPVISNLAERGSGQAFHFPRPMLASGDFNFSFSGLKTAVLYTVKKIKRLTPQVKANICASFQAAVVEVLTQKTLRAAGQHKAKTVLLTGGVAANKALRQQIEQQARAQKLYFVVPDYKFCTDNAAMIAAAGAFGKSVAPEKIRVNPNLPIS